MSVGLPEVMRQLSTLSPERVDEVYDFVMFLKSRPTGLVEDSDAWSDEDREDAIRAGWQSVEAQFANEADHET